MKTDYGIEWSASRYYVLVQTMRSETKLMHSCVQLLSNWISALWAKLISFVDFCNYFPFPVDLCWIETPSFETAKSFVQRVFNGNCAKLMSTVNASAMYNSTAISFCVRCNWWVAAANNYGKVSTPPYGTNWNVVHILYTQIAPNWTDVCRFHGTNPMPQPRQSICKNVKE